MNVPGTLPRVATTTVRRPPLPRAGSSIVRHAILIAVGAIVAYPFYFMLSSSLKPFFEAIQVPPTVFPHEVHPENYTEAWSKAPWPRYFANTLFISLAITAGELVTSVLAAYAFARINFRGKGLLFTILLATYMMPAEATLIPNYVMMAKPIPGQSPFFPILRLGLYDTYQAQILPFLASAVSIFLLRQQFLSVPKELHDAAVIDGAGHFRFLWSIVLPISVPALVTVAILSFYGSWNAFQWPLIVTSNPDIRPVQVGLNAFRAEAGTSYHLLMAAAAFVVAPIVLIYLVGQRYLVQGVARTGIRG
ncbi:MAG TPA: carbohydrate ABC transporter permease [Candidatus Limnocylindrales bacterium]|nr:carbohydrate ABC transporter permease [Candidatus Limnocylindrales bacterium]